jgi:hypothetical protein
VTTLARRIGAGLVVAGETAAVYFGFLRERHMHWGRERGGGDRGARRRRADAAGRHRRDPRGRDRRAPSAVWPWLVQMGPGRGGAYTYDWIERRLGVDIHNVDRVVPELQNLEPGDEIAMPSYTMRVERLDKERRR